MARQPLRNCKGKARKNSAADADRLGYPPREVAQ
jgi:hypothetical protein